jgi:hypothetical protein
MFRPKTLEILTDERVQSLRQFSEKAGPVLQSHIPTAEYIIDVLLNDYLAWSELDDHPTTTDIEKPMVARGGLDFIAACIHEDKDVAHSWDFLAECHDSEFRHDLVKCGLHGIHFRMNLKTQSDRMIYTCKLADIMFDRSGESSHLGIVPLTGFSLVSGHLEDCIDWYVIDEYAEEGGYTEYSEQELMALCGPTNHPILPIEDKAAFRRLVEQKIFGDEFPESRHAWGTAAKIEQALLPLIYNYGYKLKARGLPGHEVLVRASSRVEALLSFLPASSEFLKALERQILINLFSAFPEDLELLNAQPEELQGVMLNPILIKDTHVRFFQKTLAGPLALFTPRYSASVGHRGTQMVSFFKDTPYPLHLDMAVRGHLQGLQEIIHLAENCPGRSMVFEQLLLDDSTLFDPHIGLIRYLAEPEQLESYSDGAVLKLFEKVIINDDVHFVRDNGKSQVPSVAPVFNQRPHLFEAVIQILEDNDRLNHTLFEWCGFGVKELKAIGKRAPSELKGAFLEDSLGF